MDELVKTLSTKLGISDVAARKAVIIVSDFLKKKLPKPLAGQIDKLLEMDKVTEEELRDLGLFQMP
jgi:hypothetical protein